MAEQQRCPACGGLATVRLGELSCPTCGYSQMLIQEQIPSRRSYQQRSPTGQFGTKAGEDPLVRGSTGEDSPGQLWRLKAGRSGRINVNYGSNAPSVAELGAFLACFFGTTILMQVAVSSLFGVGGIGLGSILSAAFMTGVLAFTFSQQIACLKGFFMLISFMIAIMSLYMAYKAFNVHNWISMAFSFVEFGLSGWLFSILYRQNIYEDL
ncbi:hypothetical protein KDL29_05770 [bacterium]|nr:hypothetical protein [bacterium]